MFAIGLLVGIVMVLSVYWLSKQKQLSWWQWLIGAIALLLLFAGVQHFFGSLRENDIKAAWVGLGIFSGMAVLLGVIDWRLIASSSKKVAA